MKKLILDESNAIEIDPVDYFDTEAEIVEPTETVEAPLEAEVTPELAENALKTSITQLIQKEFQSIEDINSLLVTFESNEEKPENFEEIKAILQTISDEKTLQIGMLTKASELIDDKDTELMNAGIEKAEEIISEPATTDLEFEGEKEEVA